MEPKEKAPDAVSQLKAENEQLRARLENIEKLLAHQQPVVAPLKLEQDREAEFARIKEEFGQSAKERSQARARQLWPGEKTEVSVKVADWPEILIPARNEDEAKTRYDKLCGILGVDAEKHKYQIGKPQPTAKEAQAAA